MANSQTENKALEAVISYEIARQRTAIRVHNCGYDLDSSGPGGERHIEVKGTSKSSFTFRWLEPKKEQCLQEDQRFWLYLVTNTDSPEPKVWEYDKAKLIERFDRIVPHHHYSFPKSDFV